MLGVGAARHGYQKIFGGAMDRFTEGVAGMGFPMPEVSAWPAALSEFAGGILFALGLLTRFAAFFEWFTMLVAAFIFHAADPLKVKELALICWAASGALIGTGPGRISVDAVIWRWLCSRRQSRRTSAEPPPDA